MLVKCHSGKCAWILSNSERLKKISEPEWGCIYREHVIAFYHGSPTIKWAITRSLSLTKVSNKTPGSSLHERLIVLFTQYFHMFASLRNHGANYELQVRSVMQYALAGWSMHRLAYLNKRRKLFMAFKSMWSIVSGLFHNRCFTGVVRIMSLSDGEDVLHDVRLILSETSLQKYILPSPYIGTYWLVNEIQLKISGLESKEDENKYWNYNVEFVSNRMKLTRADNISKSHFFCRNITKVLYFIQSTQAAKLILRFHRGLPLHH